MKTPRSALLRSLTTPAHAIALAAVATGSMACNQDLAYFPPLEGGENTEATETVVGLAVATDTLSTLVEAVVAADLAGTLDGEGPFTVFAPSNAAFDAAFEALGITPEQLLADTETLTEILLYHVAGQELVAADIIQAGSVGTLQGDEIAVSFDGEVVTLNGSATVVAADIGGTNGVVHVIDGVLLPPDDEPVEPVEPVEGSIVDIAVATERLSTLVDAVIAADLATTLDGPGPYTVFAPTNEAFAGLLGSLGITADELFADVDALREVLLYHVVASAYPAAEIGTLSTLGTAAGGTLSVELIDGVVLIGGAKVVAADIQSSNGIVHIIDSVLLP